MILMTRPEIFGCLVSYSCWLDPPVGTPDAYAGRSQSVTGDRITEIVVGFDKLGLASRHN